MVARDRDATAPVEPRPIPGEPGLSVERDVPCRMADGVALRADVYRPTEGGPFPVLLMRLPYDKRQAEGLNYAHPSWYARHGYVVVVQDCRGRWASEGEWYPFRDEAADGAATIEWAARLPGANGRVGMYGASYAGATQLLAATHRPPSLATICPAVTASRYDEGWTYEGGALSLAFVASWATQLAMDQARRRGDAAEFARLVSAFNNGHDWYGCLPLSAYPPLANGVAPYFQDWLAHPPDDDVWRRWSIEADYRRIVAPALHVAGWYDVFLGGSVRNFVGLRRAAGNEVARRGQKLLVGPWTHLPWVSVCDHFDSVAGPRVVDDWQLRWFDHILKGEPDDGLLTSPVTVFVQGEERWRDLDDWPPPGATATPFYLHSDGRANSALGDGRLAPDRPEAEPPDRFVYDPLSPAPSPGGHSCCFEHVAPMGPIDQEPRERWNTVLVYTSEPLERDLVLLGEASVTLYAATTATDTDWTARLCRIDPAGESINLREGIIRARYRESFAAPSLLEPDRVYRYEIVLGPIGVRVPAGHRLRLQVSSSDFPHWDRNLNTGGPLFAEPSHAAVVATQTVLHDAAHPSCVALPVMRDEH